MMKKRWLALGLTLVLVLSGCGANKQSHDASASSSASTVKQVRKVTYSSLGAKQRHQVEFRFHATSDGGSDTLYNVRASITNHTKKAVTFSKAKFFIKSTTESDRIMADTKGKVTVQPGKHITINKLFMDVNVTVFKGAGTFYYLDTNYPLAYTYHAHQGNGSDSRNLQDSGTQAAQTNASSASAPSSSSTSTNANSASATPSAKAGSNNSSSNNTASNGNVNAKNLTTGQLQAWAYQHATADYSFTVTPADFDFTFGTNSAGEATVNVYENHSTKNMQAHGADPNTQPLIASYAVNSQGALVNTITQQVVATHYDAQ